MRQTLIFDIQRFSIHDGPGVRTTIFFKGCPLRCAWCQNPESQNAAAEIAFYKDKCKGLQKCEISCPQNAILNDLEGKIDRLSCDACGLCVSACDAGAFRLVGLSWKREQLLEFLLKDKIFFQESGGGITFSGGEPLLHSSYILDLSQELKKHGIHITIETAGFFAFQQIEKLLPFIDLIYFDLKHLDDSKHQDFTGVSNVPILNNFAKLASNFSGLQARMPVIPSFNDDEIHIIAVADFLKKHHQKSIHCLPYHNFGMEKRKLIDYKSQKNYNESSLEKESFLKVVETFRKQQIEVVTYDE